ncbi:MAG: hypothetical protein JKY88_05335 [Pseudomonadales bacterium]|nr:hypothetical protein [Pseudomonadales bacterium]
MKQYFRKGAFVSLYDEILNSPAYGGLSCNARCLLLELARVENHYTKNGDICISQKDAANLLKTRADSIPRIYDELVDHGFLIERKGEHHKKNRLGQKWIMTTLSYEDQKATDEWRKWGKDNGKNNVVPICKINVKGKPKRNRLSVEFQNLAIINDRV